jgi:hypothetical protein
MKLMFFFNRLDADNNQKKTSNYFDYDCEMHIFFDDAIENFPNTGISEPNNFVKNFVLLVEEAAS